MNPTVANLAASALAALVAAPAIGAEIREDRVNGVPVIMVEGQIEYGDERRFEAVARGMDRATVAFAGPGGNLHAGMEIGKSIRARGFDTAVPNLCASACALAWLGGRNRLAHVEARVGFHGAWMERDGRSEVVSGGNALVGAYLNQLGFSQSAILYMTSAGPQQMTWLSPSDARREGIAVAWKDGSGRTTVADRVEPDMPRREIPPAPHPHVRVSLAGPPQRGEWIQVASRRSLEDAVPVARSLAGRGAEASVFRSGDGWYAVAIGPYPTGRGRDAMREMVVSGKAPRDSLVTVASRYAALAWSPTTRAAGPVPTYEGPGSLRDED